MLGFPTDDRDRAAALAASDARLNARWDACASTGRDFIRRGDFARAFARRNGVGSSDRAAVWAAWSGARARREAEVGTRKMMSWAERVAEAAAGESQCRASFEQIDLDLPRTFPEHERFREPDGDALVPLRRVLRVLAVDCAATCGYVQGMNYVAGFFLLVYDGVEGGEEDAYWTLRCVVEDMFPGYFEPGLKPLRADLEELDRRFSIVCPEAHAKLESLGLPVKYFTARWLMCGLIGCAAAPTVLRVWDLIFVDSDRSPRETLMRCCLAMLALQAPFVRAAEDMNASVTAIREAGWTIDNVDAYLQRVADLREQVFPEKLEASQVVAATPSRKRTRYEPPPTPVRAAMTPVANNLYASLVSFFSPTPSKAPTDIPPSARAHGLAPKRLWSFEDKPLRKTPPMSGFRHRENAGDGNEDTQEVEMSTPSRKRAKTTSTYVNSPLEVARKTPLKSPARSPLMMR